MILFDFRELETLPKVILFLLVGVIALVISFLYIYLEKKDDNDELLEADSKEETEQITQSEKGML